jgi:hypothetical protein
MKDFLLGVGAGGIAGVGCAIPATIEALFFGLGIIKAIAWIAGASSLSGCITFIIFGAAIFIGFGVFIGTLTATVHAINVSNKSEFDIWATQIPGIVGSCIGLAIGGLGFARGGSIFLIISGITEGYLLAAAAVFIYKKLAGR